MKIPWSLALLQSVGCITVLKSAVTGTVQDAQYLASHSTVSTGKL